MIDFDNNRDNISTNKFPHYPNNGGRKKKNTTDDKRNIYCTYEFFGRSLPYYLFSYFAIICQIHLFSTIGNIYFQDFVSDI